MKSLLRVLCILGTLLFCCEIHASAPPYFSQAPDETSFSGEYYNSDLGLHIYLDLQKESLEIPSMEFLGSMHGYMQGGIYGVWMLIKHETKRNKVVLRFTNDIGSDSQTIELIRLGDGKYQYKAIGENLVRKAVGRKLVKITDTMIMKKIEKQ